MTDPLQSPAPNPPTCFIKIRPYSLLQWLMLPLLGFVWLWFLPPHALDVAVSKMFFHDGVWWGRTQAWIEPLLHQLPKYVSIVVAMAALGRIVGLAVRMQKVPADSEACRLRIRRLAYLLISMAACVLAVSLLKMSTGVSCPASTVEFGGAHDIRSAAHGFAFESVPGRCWPSGAAGSGFCLLGLYFFFRDRSKKAACLGFLLALTMGLLAGVGRMSDGMHFASHVAASFFVDWVISAVLYLVFFNRSQLLKRLLIELKGRLAFELPAGGLKPGKPIVRRSECVIFTALWWTLVYDAPMFSRLLGLPETLTWTKISLFLGSAVAFGLLAAALTEMLSWLPLRVFRAVMVLLASLGALGFAGSYLYGIVYTPDMVRNFLATDSQEAMGYLSLRTAAVFLCAWIPLLWLSLHFAPRRASSGAAGAGFFIVKLKTAATRLGIVAALIGAALAMVLANFQAFSGAMRADKSLRYQIVPVIMVYSLVRTLTADASPDKHRVRLVMDPNPQRLVVPERPTLFVVVVGETTRSANWQLAGYGRETNPRLSERDIINISRVGACGTSTDVSVPCMMSRIGRSDYSRERILNEEALPDVLKRAGYDVLWVDNQSGCKGVCAGVASRGPSEELKKTSASCRDGSCMDGILVDEVRAAVAGLERGRSQVLFLHMMGSHGPAYHSRSPQEDKAWLPECKANDLGSCTAQELVNAYDNSVRYTDRVLAEIIDELKDAAEADTAMIYVSDHGESLGEKGVYLHGAPYWLAPQEQLTVPMVLWLSENFVRDYKIDEKELQRKASEEVSHEHLYHTVLGLLQIQSVTKNDRLDLTARERKAN